MAGRSFGGRTRRMLLTETCRWSDHANKTFLLSQNLPNALLPIWPTVCSTINCIRSCIFSRSPSLSWLSFQLIQVCLFTTRCNGPLWVKFFEPKWPKMKVDAAACWCWKTSFQKHVQYVQVKTTWGPHNGTGVVQLKSYCSVWSKAWMFLFQRKVLPANLCSSLKFHFWLEKTQSLPVCLQRFLGWWFF